MSIIATYVKSPTETLLYTLGYSDWVDADQSEVLTGASTTVSPVTVPPLVAASAFSNISNVITLTVSGGEVDTTYTVQVTATSSLSQIKEDCLQFILQEPCV